MKIQYLNPHLSKNSFFFWKCILLGNLFEQWSADLINILILPVFFIFCFLLGKLSWVLLFGNHNMPSKDTANLPGWIALLYCYYLEFCKINGELSDRSASCVFCRLHPEIAIRLHTILTRWMGKPHIEALLDTQKHEEEFRARNKLQTKFCFGTICTFSNTWKHKRTQEDGGGRLLWWSMGAKFVGMGKKYF